MSKKKRTAGRPRLNEREPLTWSPKVRLPERVRRFVSRHRGTRGATTFLRELIERGMRRRP